MPLICRYIYRGSSGRRQVESLHYNACALSSYCFPGMYIGLQQIVCGFVPSQRVDPHLKPGDEAANIEIAPLLAYLQVSLARPSQGNTVAHRESLPQSHCP